MDIRNQLEASRDGYVAYLIRDGVRHDVPSKDLVVDDILFYPHEGIDYWEVYRILAGEAAFSPFRAIALYPAVENNLSIPFHGRPIVVKYRSDESVVVLRAA